MMMPLSIKSGPRVKLFAQQLLHKLPGFPKTQNL
ncbi:MAG: hypothetical protein FD131_251 [Rhodocyclaceae bacterium]|nr:MAG: hypothetical protein FD131_251 [Rhodocyclaceae bacterium]